MAQVRANMTRAEWVEWQKKARAQAHPDTDAQQATPEPQSVERVTLDAMEIALLDKCLYVGMMDAIESGHYDAAIAICDIAIKLGLDTK